jgi:septum site-determining protein MinC
MTTTRGTTSFKFRGGTFHALVVKPETPIAVWLGDIDKVLARSPGFFAGKSVVIDVSGLSLGKDAFLSLLDELSAREIRILGVEGADPACVDGRIPSLTAGKAGKETKDRKAAAPAIETSTPAPPSSMLIEKPVRSGQQIIHPHGDVTVIGSVSSGAEIVAAGSVHIYGTLRGRVLAGAYGNSNARIFCKRLEAELMSIDGHYLMADDIEQKFRKTCIQARLEKDALELTTMD